MARQANQTIADTQEDVFADDPTTEAALPARIETNLQIARFDAGELADVLTTNMGPTGLSAQDLDRVIVPPGGGLAFAVPTLEGEESIQELEGVIVAFRNANAYWSVSLDESGGGSPPDCASADGIYGNGDPGGSCELCPMNQFGSSPKGEGKACKNTIQLFLCRPDDLLPLVISCPPTSIKAVRQYMRRLSSKALPYFAVITRLKLQREKSGAGITYSEIVPSFVRTLDGAERERVRSYANAVNKQLTNVAVQRQDVEAVAA